jgi:hypothetical protein
MTDEFDETMPPLAVPVRAAADARITDARLVARLFAAAAGPLRVGLLRCLMRPLGPLGAAGVAAGVFAAFLDPRGGGEPIIDPHTVARLSSPQVRELAHFVEQVDPQALQQFADMASSSPLAVAGFSASALLLLYRRLQPIRPPS